MKKSLHIEAGLTVLQGEDGTPQWCGTNQQWAKYEELREAQELIDEKINQDFLESELEGEDDGD